MPPVTMTPTVAQLASSWRLRKVPTPQDLFELAAHNAIVKMCMDSWRHGEMTWEQALTTAVVHLAHHNAHLMESATTRFLNNPIALDQSTQRGPTEGPKRPGDPGTADAPIVAPDTAL